MHNKASIAGGAAMKLFTACVLFVTVSVSACADLPRYKRSDCIVRINVEWPSGMNEETKEDSIRSIADAVRKAPDLGFNRIQPSSAIQGDKRQFVYYQFKDDCEHRIENAETLLSHVRRELGNQPSLTVDPGSFEPGVDTIRSSGPWWLNQE